MKRFKPKPGRSSRATGRIWGAVFAAWGILVLLYLVWLGMPHAEPVSATLPHAVTRTQVPLSGSYAGTWDGKPVYVIHNGGGSLENVSVYNWAEDVLPVLYIGPPGTFELSGKNLSTTLLPAPYNLPQGADIWVVASSKPPTEFKVTWDSPEGVLYTTFSVDEASANSAALLAMQSPLPLSHLVFWHLATHFA